MVYCGSWTSCLTNSYIGLYVSVHVTAHYHVGSEPTLFRRTILCSPTCFGIIEFVRCVEKFLRGNWKNCPIMPQDIGLSHEIAISAKVIWKRDISCKQSWRTVVWCFAQMIGDVRMNIEKERTENCISFLRTRNEGKSWSTVIDGKLCHTEPTLPLAMTVYKYWKR